MNKSYDVHLTCPYCGHNHSLVEYIKREATIPSFQCVPCSIVTNRYSQQKKRKNLKHNNKGSIYFGRIKNLAVRAILGISLLIIFWG